MRPIHVSLIYETIKLQILQNYLGNIINYCFNLSIIKKQTMNQN